jgi:hypothetical protein
MAAGPAVLEWDGERAAAAGPESCVLEAGQKPSKAQEQRPANGGRQLPPSGPASAGVLDWAIALEAIVAQRRPKAATEHAVCVERTGTQTSRG